MKWTNIVLSFVGENGASFYSILFFISVVTQCYRQQIASTNYYLDIDCDSLGKCTHECKQREIGMKKKTHKSS